MISLEFLTKLNLVSVSIRVSNADKMTELANLILFQQELQSELMDEVRRAVLFSDFQLGHAQARFCGALGTLMEYFHGLRTPHVKRGNPAASERPLDIQLLY
jgi:hypothetical protein